jgi:hypothetical protein
VLAGIACLFRLEIGIAAIIGVAMEAPIGARARAAAIGSGCGVVVLAPFILVSPGAMWHDTLGFYGIQGLQRLPFPLGFHGPLRPSKLIEFYIPLILVIGLAMWAIATAMRAGPRPPVYARAALGGGITATMHRPARIDPASLSLVPLALVGLAYLIGRTDVFHLIPLAAVLPIMLAQAAATARIAAVRIALLCALGLIVLHGLDRRAGQLLHPPSLAAVPGPAGDGVKTETADAGALGSLERSIHTLLAPGEPIFVANPRHDRVTAGDPLLYVILGHPNPTRYDVMQPGLVTTASVQRQIVDSLRRSKTKVVIRWLDPRAEAIEPNGSARSSGVHILDRYLAAAYRPYARFGVYQVLVLRAAQ